MGKAYVVSDVRFENDVIILSVDGQVINLNLSDISEKLANASIQEKNDYKISPSGYGIHWTSLDEDLSINGLLKTYNSKLHHRA